jgi:hypothetical protein
VGAGPHASLRRRRRSRVLDAVDQRVDVLRVEADCGAEVDGAELAALDEALHGSRVDVEDRGGLLCRQQRSTRRRVGRFGDCGRGPTLTRLGSRCVASSRAPSRPTLAALGLRLVGRGVEERQLLRVERHEDR